MSTKVEWIQLSVDMFSSPKLKHIQTLPEKDAVIAIWIQLLCMAGKCNDKGMIYITESVPYDDQTLSHELNQPINTVKLALSVLERLNMINFVKNNILMVTGFVEHQNIKGLDSIKEQNRLRQQRYREHQSLKQIEADNVTLNVTLRNAPPLIEREKDIDTEEEKKEMYKERKEELSALSEQIPYQEIIQYLNQKANTSYKHTTQAYRRLINGRWKEGFRLDDFKKVIDNKVVDWFEDPNMQKYIRPETLFRPAHFQSYLNEKPKPKIQPSQFEHCDGLREVQW